MYAKKYAEAIDTMMKTKGTHLDLPSKFMEEWRKNTEK
jgi:hypothetical protein